MFHPFSAHFAVVLPLLATVLSLTFLLFKKEYLSRFSSYTSLLGAIAMIIAYITGDSAGYAVWESVSKDAQELIEQHASFGMYVLIAVVIAAGLKMFAFIKQYKRLEYIAFVILFLTSIMVLNQGKMGGELVYKYGAGVEKILIQ